MIETRDVAASLGELFAEGVPLRVEKGRVTAVNAGPPATVDVRLLDTFDVPRIRCLASYTPRAVNDAVYVLVYGSAKRVVLGKEG